MQFYDTRFDMKLTQREKADLAAFLAAARRISADLGAY